MVKTHEGISVEKLWQNKKTSTVNFLAKRQGKIEVTEVQTLRNIKYIDSLILSRVTIDGVWFSE
jgi:hypothetical protein